MGVVRLLQDQPKLQGDVLEKALDQALSEMT